MTTIAQAGTLAPYELLGLTGRLAKSGFAGVLRLAFQRGEVRVFFTEGVVRYCMGTGMHHSLPAHLLRTGRMSQTELKQRIAVAKSQKVRLEEILMRTGTIDQKQLRELQADNSVFVFGEACGHGQVTYKLDDHAPPTGIERFTLDPWRAVLSWASQHDKRDHNALLAEHRHDRLEPGEAYGAHATAAHLAFGAPFLAAKQALESMATLSELNDPHVARVVYTLWKLGMVRFGAPVPRSIAIEDQPSALPEDDGATPVEHSTPVLSVAQAASLPTAGAPAHELSGMASLCAAEGLAWDALEPGAGVQVRIPALERAEEALASIPLETDEATALPPIELDDLEPGDPVVRTTHLPGGEGLSAALADAVAAAVEEPAAPAPRARKKAVWPSAKADATSPTMTPTPMAVEEVDYPVTPVDLNSWIPALEAGRSVPDDPMLEAIFEVRKRMYNATHFDILHVLPGAPLSVIMDQQMLLKSKYDPTAYMGTYMTPQSRNDLDIINKVVDKVVSDLIDPPRRRWLEKEAGGMSSAELTAYFEAHASFRQGRDAFEAKRYGPALEAFQQAAEKNGKDPFYHLWCARSLRQMLMAEDGWDAAGKTRVERHLNDAILLKSHFEDAQMELAAVMREKGEGARALKIYQSIVSHNPRAHAARKAIKTLEESPEGTSGANESLGGRLGGLLGRLKKK